ncbi:MAG TPA: hypothetical protein DEO99_06185 [Bacteroidetes bacterium]|nr:hypothetical protein [Bacteroidota bacterium]
MMLRLTVWMTLIAQWGWSQVSYTDPAIILWGDSVQIIRGYQDLADSMLGLAGYGVVSDALGEADGNVVSLGDGGEATYFFASGIPNGNGPDVAIFENALDMGGGQFFAELAFVEVSTDGIEYHRFPCQSLTQTNGQINGFGGIMAYDIQGFAGIHPTQTGTLFDLEQIDALNPLDTVYYVRCVDVIGSVDPSLGSYDSQGNLINDPYPTPFASSGFDIDAVAYVKDYSVPTAIETIANFPNSAMLINTGQLLTHYFNDKLWVVDTQGMRTPITSLTEVIKGYQWIVEYNQSNNQWTVVEVILGV